ncbi:MAG: hypothetical protein CSA95_02080 [Bacteroidetes bacterium]|nr:MAG: hypothetical protein CSA95_02080 [Bacteroidota bacterium]
MKLRVGDTVKFLNQEGGGRVSKILSPEMVNVAIEEGFEIPTLVKDLVKVDNDSPLGRYFGEHYEVDLDVPVAASRKEAQRKAPSPQEQCTTPATPPPPVAPQPTRKSPIPYRINDSSFRKGVYLSFVPEDQQYLISGSLNIYLVNHTESDILFSLFLKSSTIGYQGRSYDTLEASSKIHLDRIDREQLNEWSFGVVQVLFHKNKQDKILEPLTATFRIQGVRFYKTDSYREAFFVGEKAFVYLLGEIAHQPVIEEEWKKPAPVEKKPAIKQAQPQVEKSLIEQHAIEQDVAEVDLHISALKTDYGRMKREEILRYQMGYFQRALENAIAKAYQKVIFIHGIGNGVLRDAIIDYLKRNYPDFEYGNASFQKYGYGALEVFIDD